VFGLSWVVGIVLLAIAERQGRAAAGSTTLPERARMTDPMFGGPVYPPPEGPRGPGRGTEPEATAGGPLYGGM
jgi:hypothetical protein